MIALLLALVVLPVLGLMLYTYRARPRFFRRPRHPEPAGHAFARKKPAWVPKEVMRLRALMPHEGCRTIARAFNSRHRAKGETVGKTYVAQTLQQNAAQVLLLRKKLKNRRRRQAPRNLTWAMDLTFLEKDSPPVLGVLDHGTRGLLSLRELPQRTTIGLLRLLLDLIETFGRPRFLRSDNEPLFASHLLTLALRLLGIRHRRIDPFCPWQNGRVERLFGTLKQRLQFWWAIAGVPSDHQHDLDTFRTWYNHARPHQSLDGLTPAMAWAGVTKIRKPPRFFQAWAGVLTGFVVST